MNNSRDRQLKKAAPPNDDATGTPKVQEVENQNSNADTTAFFDSLEAALAAAAPQGSAVHAVGFDSVDAILGAGYRVTDGDADITIARGGEREFSKARETACDKLILFPTHAFAAAATDVYRKSDAAFAVMERGQKPFAAVFDARETDRNLASVYGEIVSLDLCAFDAAFAARMRGEKTDEPATSEISRLVSELTAELKAVEKDRAAISAALTEAGKKAARIIERRPQLLHASGASQTAEALRMLYSAEERPLGMRGETEMLLCPYVTDFYIKNLNTRGLDFPPDNNRRIDSVCEYFATDIRRACVYATAIYPPIKMRLCEYRRDEFRAELISRLADIKRRQYAAWQVFKRLYPDDGYCLKTLVDRTDLGICLALAPDVFGADTMLSFLKQTGRLEKYIV
ncbi:MAG: hypothetical protein NC184_05990 [Roseburia sp.]|nr:hypothetical protein [Roseburia sp.]